MPRSASKVKAVKKVAKTVKTSITKVQKRKSVSKNYFTVGEDLVIAEALLAQKEAPKSQVASTVAAKLGRTTESIRDRIKRYHNKLSSADKTQLIKEGKKNPSHYAFFVRSGDSGEKKLEKISAQPPILQQRFITRKPRTSKKPKVVVDKHADAKSFEEKTNWVIEKLTDKDPYFQLDFSVQLLSDIFAILNKQFHIPLNQIDNFVQNIDRSLTLEEILDHFKIRKA